MNPKAALIALACLQLGVSGLPVKQKKASKQKFVVPLFLLGSSNVLVNVSNQTTADVGTRQGEVAADDAANVQADEATGTSTLPTTLTEAQHLEAYIRQQFLQSFVQSLRPNNVPTLPPAVVVQLTRRPVIERDDEYIDDNDAEYEYIDFKKGSRIIYDLDNNQQSFDYVERPNPILQLNTVPQLVGYFRR
ncbi:hypothetical protein KR044_001114 [Drosophila immigrans]|nr:hypothetical protein KR044_001114 [Drosophila immigrans]